MRLNYHETWTSVWRIRPVTYIGRRPPQKEPYTGAAMFALVGAVIGGVAGGAGGAAIGFLGVCVVWSFLKEQEKNS